MNEYAISFRRLKTICIHVTHRDHFNNSIGFKLRTRHACRKRMNMNWTKSDKPGIYIECTEKNCPVLENCDQVIP